MYWTLQPLEMWNLLKRDLKIQSKAPRQHSVSVYETNCLLFWESNKPHTAHPPWEVNSQSVCQISRLLWNQNVHHHVHTSPTTGKYPQPHEHRPHFHIHNTTNRFKLSCLLHSDFTCGLFLNLKILQLCGLHLSPTQVAHPTLFTLSDLNTLIKCR